MSAGSLSFDILIIGSGPGGYVTAIAEGRYRDAYLIARRPNPFASICGRVCAAPCEVKCRRGALDEAVSIRALKRFVTERFGVESFAANTMWHAVMWIAPAKQTAYVAVTIGVLITMVAALPPFVATLSLTSAAVRIAPPTPAAAAPGTALDDVTYG